VVKYKLDVMGSVQSWFNHGLIRETMAFSRHCPYFVRTLHVYLLIRTILDFTILVYTTQYIYSPKYTIILAGIRHQLEYNYVYTLYTYTTISMARKMHEDRSRISQFTPAQGCPTVHT
jgi:hypothetical protein